MTAAADQSPMDASALAEMKATGQAMNPARSGFRDLADIDRLKQARADTGRTGSGSPARSRGGPASSQVRDLKRQHSHLVENLVPNPAFFGPGPDPA